MNLNQVKDKIAKLLRLQTSSNAGEAANAAAFVEKLCAKYNVSSTDCKDYDPEKDEVVEFQVGKVYRKANVPEQNLIHGVTKYFNGQTIITYVPSNSMFYEPPKRVMNVIASKGNKIQIELYLEYLIETMDKLADEAKKSGGYGTARTTYKTNWKKGFSKKIADYEKTFNDFIPAESILSQPNSSIIDDFLIITSPVIGCFTSVATTLPKALSDKLTTTLPPSKISESSINPGSSHLTLVIVKS